MASCLVMFGAVLAAANSLPMTVLVAEPPNTPLASISPLPPSDRVSAINPDASLFAAPAARYPYATVIAAAQPLGENSPAPSYALYSAVSSADAARILDSATPYMSHVSALNAATQSAISHSLDDAGSAVAPPSPTVSFAVSNSAPAPLLNDARHATPPLSVPPSPVTSVHLTDSNLQGLPVRSPADQAHLLDEDTRVTPPPLPAVVFAHTGSMPQLTISDPHHAIPPIAPAAAPAATEQSPDDIDPAMPPPFPAVSFEAPSHTLNDARNGIPPPPAATAYLPDDAVSTFSPSFPAVSFAAPAHALNDARNEILPASPAVSPTATAYSHDDVVPAIIPPLPAVSLAAPSSASSHVLNNARNGIPPPPPVAHNAPSHVAASHLVDDAISDIPPPSPSAAPFSDSSHRLNGAFDALPPTPHAVFSSPSAEAAASL